MTKGGQVPQGDKSAYTEKQMRQAAHIVKGYRRRGLSLEDAERRAWATINKIHGGGRLSGSGRGRSARSRAVKSRARRRAR